MGLDLIGACKKPLQFKLPRLSATPTGLEETLKTEAFDAFFYKDGAALEQLVSILSALDPKELEKLLRQVQEE